MLLSRSVLFRHQKATIMMEVMAQQPQPTTAATTIPTLSQQQAATNKVEPQTQSQTQSQTQTQLQVETITTTSIVTPKTTSTSSQQLEQDGKRTLIKNQLYLIEQLQLENANLRNERDQLQLENEELKFQLQMIW